MPVIHNLVFVHACPSEVKRVKSQINYLQYITDTRSGQKIIIPDNDMQRFIAVAGTYNDHLLYFQRDRRVVIEIQGVIAVAMATIHPDLIEVIE